MPNRSVTAPLTPGSVARLKAGYAAIEQATANMQGLVVTILEAMGIEGRVEGLNLEEATVTVSVPGLTAVEPLDLEPEA